ncbi:MAG: glycosyltransferase family 2 protein [Patescibacteria group bacterium]|nr:glycosyltransferase family 2 protein [Patescibacteria group bacterium]
MSPRVLVVLVNWNNYSDTQKCISSLFILDYSNLDILVVDNGSTNHAVEQLEKEFPRVHFIRNNENVGYAGGANIGISYGIDNKYDYIWLLNNDTIIVDPHYLTTLITVAQNEGCDIVGSLALNLEDQMVQSEWFVFIPWRGRFVAVHKNFSVGSIEKRDLILRGKEYLNAASMLVRTNVFQRYGLWPETFFLYFEDNTWEDIVRKGGVNICYTSKTYLLHKGAASSGGYKKSIVLDYYDTRNYLYFIRESYPAWLWYHIFKSIINKVMPKIIRCEYLRLRYVLYGLRDFFMGRTGKFF